MGTMTATQTWLKRANVAQYDGAEWHEVQRVSNTTKKEAKKIADKNPKITFFFHCRQPMYLTKHGQFNPGDAVFFSGDPWYGSAPQCDAYEQAMVYWTKRPNVVQYKGADWKNHIRTEHKISLERAKEISAASKRITYFFYCREPMFLEGNPPDWTQKGEFNPGDAVFFSGKPWYDSAPQCDAYEESAVTWAKKANVAQYGGASWANEVPNTRMHHTTVEAAQEQAAEDTRITFFFYCRQPMYLIGKGQFNPGDAIFFSGKPWYGSAPQCDAYEKDTVPLWDL